MTIKSNLKTVWIMFGIFMLLFVLNFYAGSNQTGATSRMWVVLGGWSLVVSVILLVKHGLPAKRQILVSLLLAAAVAAAYINVSLFSMIETSVITLFASLAVFSTFSRFRENRLVFLHTASKKSVAVSLLTGAAAGAVLGIINLLLSGKALDSFSIKFAYFKIALSPAIYEEMAMRAVFYALCLSLLNGRMDTRARRFTAWFMMIIPHVLIHTPDIFINNGIVPGIVNIIMLALLFGLPFAILQKKRDIASAMLAHGIVDVIRFCFFGLPY
ncbi:hypothetical protein R70723_10655 [Paenibacillus sp. FSL R7-0273]|uniref:CPBP family intramembrane metalloprotease n=1 Tax=Paenibacillus sp. FSL R7-0273 TaxID=1536772 RepID=UPI0004F7D39C|nr:CPBP family intramembrane metalloprotease [Paenibacillus sp. FSL R7-0273]AIQ46288.1 hypothetical protein R70723_10655 [Paenibacillus sp. FSL R7-0273]OMF89396.1 hypothetical protein BK144_19685 [Paenibacillus sp. FSL R7-0273]